MKLYLRHLFCLGKLSNYFVIYFPNHLMLYLISTPLHLSFHFHRYFFLSWQHCLSLMSFPIRSSSNEHIKIQFQPRTRMKKCKNISSDFKYHTNPLNPQFDYNLFSHRKCAAFQTKQHEKYIFECHKLILVLMQTEKQRHSQNTEHSMIHY